MPLIASVSGRVINDSRGQQTVEVTVTDDQGRLATASLPAGSSVGKYEPVMVDAQTAVTTINTTLAPALLRTPLTTLEAVDTMLAGFDPTPNREKIGVNSLLGISLACARLFAQIENVPLYAYIQHVSSSPGYTLPNPVFNLINGGKHANNNLDFQEYMIIPHSMKSFHEKLSAGRRIFAALGNILHEAGLSTESGAEGGYAPTLDTNEQGLGYLVEAIKTAGFVPESDVFLGLDVAASALPPTYAATVESYHALLENFPIYWIEDPFREDNADEWQSFKRDIDTFEQAGRPKLLVGDDLFASSVERLSEGLEKQAANAVLIKMNQAGTLTEILKAIEVARTHGCTHALSNRSGETLDAFVSDLAVGTAAAFMKAGAPNDQAPERIIKYERVAEIEEELQVVRK